MIHFDYKGDARFESYAKQCADLIEKACLEVQKICASPVRRNTSGIEEMCIYDQGKLVVMPSDSAGFTPAFIVGKLAGFASARGKRCKLTGTDDVPVLSFESFADLAEVVNSLAKSVDEKIDVQALPRQAQK